MTLRYIIIIIFQTHFLQDNGDFRTSSETKTCNAALCEYYAYMNGWVVMAAQRLGRFDVAVPGYKYPKTYMCEDQLGGFTTNGPVAGGNGVTDIFSTSHFGLISLYFGGKSKRCL